MKRIYFFLFVSFLLSFSTTAWGVCPADTMDRGLCDTMYIDPLPADTLQSGSGPYFVRVPIFVTADVFDKCDSIQAFQIPLCYTHTNAAKYCSVSYYWNNYTNYSNPRSVFRDLVSEGDTIHNWMMDQWEKGDGEEWNDIILNLASDSSMWYFYNGTYDDSMWVPSHFFLALISIGVEDHLFEAGSRILLATMTFKVEDTMQICLDTCFWPPANQLAWAINDFEGEVCGASHTKIPRLGSPHQTSYHVCFNLHREDFLCGDVNRDAVVDVGDAVYLINYLFKSGPPPNPVNSGDVNGDDTVDVSDVVYLLNYLFKSGPAPNC